MYKRRINCRPEALTLRLYRPSLARAPAIRSLRKLCEQIHDVSALHGCSYDNSCPGVYDNAYDDLDTTPQIWCLFFFFFITVSSLELSDT